jgi:uncharacterized membrane protein
MALAAVGLLTCLGLEFVHVRAYLDPGAGSLCTLGERLDCVSVALSKLAVVLGLPLPLWGVIGFVAIGLAAWQRSRALLALATLAAGAGVVLTALSAWQVGSLCWLCELVHSLSLGIFVLAWREREALSRPLADGAAAARVLAAPLGLGVAFLLFVPSYWGMFGWKGEPPFAHGRTSDGSAWIGAEQPQLTLEEYVDYSCPHCKAASARSLMLLASRPGKLRLVRRYRPRTHCLPSSEGRCLETRIAICADEQDRFWQADRWLFAHAGGAMEPSVEDAAHDIGLDRERLSECLTRETTFQRAAAERKRARQLHIPGTPYYASGDSVLTASAAAALIDAL